MSTDLFVTCILGTLAYPVLRDWVWAYFPVQYFKSANKEPAYKVSSESGRMSTSLFVTCILGTLVLSAVRASVWAYLHLQYFKSANKKLVYHVPSKLVQPFGSDPGTYIYTYIYR
ncbi:hypothetical protein AVEN_208232-1 [Araneus ventricosus]|uniref:Uncharacterized protein n=1 Tax=Araneus ventricosus TaxID=182803 RepID=A0A4Y2I305_ARAVE|nr:hypothetical protein AVEN_208232-1 [Araneus ventricosus]